MSEESRRARGAGSGWPRLRIHTGGPFSVGALMWRGTRGERMCTMIAKVTYPVRPDTVQPLADPLPLQEHDGHWDDDLARSLHLPSDLAPFKNTAEVVVVGSAFAHPGPALCTVPCCSVGNVQKALEAWVPRRFAGDGTILDSPPQTRFSLRYEHAAGGPETDNPAGVDVARYDLWGRRNIPGLLPLAHGLGAPGSFIPTVGFGPIAEGWPSRQSLLSETDRAWLRRPRDAPLPTSFPARFYQTAPPDQWLDRPFAGNERIILEGLHAKRPRLVMSLAGAEPRVVVPRGPRDPFRLRGDLLVIDTERELLTLTFRGHFELPPDVDQVRVIVAEDPATVSAPPSLPPSAQPVSAIPRDAAALRAGDTVADDEDVEEIEAVEMTGSPAMMRSGPTLPFYRPKDIAPSSAEAAGPPPPPKPSVPPASVAPPPRPSTPPPSIAATAAPEPPSLRNMPFATAAPEPPPPRNMPFVAAAPEPPSLRSMPVAAPAPEPPPPRSMPVVTAAPEPPPLRSMPVAAAAPEPPPLRSMPVAAPAPEPPPPPRDAPVAPAPAASPPARGTLWGKAAPAAEASPFGSLKALSDAAAGAEPLPSAKLFGAKAPKAAPDQAGSERVAIVDLLGFDPKLPPRLRSARRFGPIFAKKDPAKAFGNTAEPVDRERADVLRVLSFGRSADLAEIRGALAECLDDANDLEPPLVLAAGDLSPSFDEVEMLASAVAIGQSIAAGDKKVLAAIGIGQEASQSPLPHRPDALLNFYRQIEQACSGLALPPRYLAAQVERVLLEGRKYKRRTLFGAPRVRASLALARSPGEAIPCYLPDTMTAALPLLPSCPVVAVCEVRPREDIAETHPQALLVLALGRVLHSR